MQQDNEDLFQHLYWDLHAHTVDMEIEQACKKVDKYFRNQEMEEDIKKVSESFQMSEKVKFSYDERIELLQLINPSKQNELDWFYSTITDSF